MSDHHGDEKQLTQLLRQVVERLCGPDKSLPYRESTVSILRGVGVRLHTGDGAGERAGERGEAISLSPRDAARLVECGEKVASRALGVLGRSGDILSSAASAVVRGVATAAGVAVAVAVDVDVTIAGEAASRTLAGGSALSVLTLSPAAHLTISGLPGLEAGVAGGVAGVKKEGLRLVSLSSGSGDASFALAELEDVLFSRLGRMLDSFGGDSLGDTGGGGGGDDAALAVFLNPASPFFSPEAASLLLHAAALHLLSSEELIGETLASGGPALAAQLTVFLKNVFLRSVPPRGGAGAVDGSGDGKNAAGVATPKSMRDAGEYIRGSKKEQAALRRLSAETTGESAAQIAASLGRLLGEAATSEVGLRLVAEEAEGETEERGDGGEKRRVYLWPQAIDALYHLSATAADGGGFADYRRLVQRYEDTMSDGERDLISSLTSELRGAAGDALSAVAGASEKASSLRSHIITRRLEEALSQKSQGDRESRESREILEIKVDGPDGESGQESLARELSGTLAAEVGSTVAKSLSRLRDLADSASAALSLASQVSLSGQVSLSSQVSHGEDAGEIHPGSPPAVLSRYGKMALRSLVEVAGIFSGHIAKLASPVTTRKEIELMSFSHAWEIIRLAAEARRRAESSGDLDSLRALSQRVKATEFLRTGGRGVDDIADPASLIKAFSLRGVQWGEYVSEERRRDILRRASASIRDLADVMGVADTALGLGGGLALAFGARGGGRPSATYEPREHVINMTRDRGDGSLAHEFFHSLDFLGKPHSGLDSPDLRRDLPDDVIEALARFKKAMLTSPAGEFIERRRREAEEMRAEAARSAAEYKELKAALQAAHKSRLTDFEARRERLTAETEKAAARKLEGSAANNDDAAAAAAAEAEAEALRQELRQDLRLETHRLRQLTEREMARIDHLRLRHNRLIQAAAELARDAEIAERGLPLSKARGKSRRSARLPLRDIEATLDQKDRDGGAVAYPSKFIDDASVLDSASSKKSAYWATTHECGARAFETFVAGRLAEEGRWNNYLADSRSLVEDQGKSPFPVGAERDRTDDAIGELIAVLRRRGLL